MRINDLAIPGTVDGPMQPSTLWEREEYEWCLRCGSERCGAWQYGVGGGVVPEENGIASQ